MGKFHVTALPMLRTHRRRACRGGAFQPGMAEM
jgi:hypothetical protein